MISGNSKNTREEEKSQPSAAGVPKSKLLTDPKVAHPARIMGSFFRKT